MFYYCPLDGPCLAEGNKEVKDDTVLPGHGDRSQSREVAGNDGPSIHQELEPFTSTIMTDRPSGGAINHSHRITEDIDISFKHNCESCHSPEN